ncbi:acyltransferase [Petrocella sp. FN5]|uniref:acyltransferase n=1 Tax=Petrocella sp. FN5 TaxID=3032002 RepID=UPI0023D9E005|nr:acyltransferase [Petrocella sp. FN5]MDF1616953.1 acyltransferase [Petrocella sp. FN5]
MLKRMYYSKVLKVILRFFLSFIYKKKYLKGQYFDEKRMGWIWAIRGIGGRFFGENRNIPWPVHPRTIISNPNNIEFHIDNINIFQTPGCYWQNHDAKIVIGRGCQVAPNVGIITTNHDLYDISKHVAGEDVVLGDYCWVGMNSVVLPGVELGAHTIVAAGAVVTKSFLDGYCVIAGVPAKKIKEIN